MNKFTLNREGNRQMTVNFCFYIIIVAISLLLYSNEKRHLPIMMISFMIMTFGAHLGHLTCSNSYMMLLGTEQGKANYRFKGYIRWA